jgi:hypothetical protein
VRALPGAANVANNAAFVAEAGSRVACLALDCGHPQEEQAMVQKKLARKPAKKVVKSAVKKPARKPAALPDTVADRNGGKTASQQISARIAELGDWRGDVLRRVRKLIKEADPEIVEEWKWENPVWSHEGIICTGESYKQVVKLTFAKGAGLSDPKSLFNSSLGGNTRRAIDIRADDEIDERALKELIRAAVLLNLSGKKK